MCSVQTQISIAGFISKKKFTSLANHHQLVEEEKEWKLEKHGEEHRKKMIKGRVEPSFNNSEVGNFNQNKTFLKHKWLNCTNLNQNVTSNIKDPLI